MYKTGTARQLCERCIRAIRSRSEKIYVGEEIYNSDYGTCDWCDESDDTLFNVRFAIELESEEQL